jgi:excisionase family DNA binding protein
VSEMKQRRFLTVEETAQKLELSVNAIRSAARRGELPGFRVGRDWRIYPEKVEKLVSGETA